ncbi:MAG: methyltransferase domain-containing protein [Desulfobacteraceae bacterium]|nr:MAG: methyltransferase domain-containing protein [Desulfobacteraceae bacterium]
MTARTEAINLPSASVAGKLYDNTGNRALINCLPPLGGYNVLDLGCGAGANAAAMTDAGANVFGITLSFSEAILAANRMRAVVVADLSRSIPFFQSTIFDLVVLSHILEHLADPVALLKEVRSILAPRGAVAVAVPSVTHYSVRFRLLRGHWSYTDTGILDWTHLRFFSKPGILRVFDLAGYEVVREGHEASFLLWKLRRLFPKSAVNAINHFFAKLSPEFFATQFVFLLKPR